jgi:hypothetical protein
MKGVVGLAKSIGHVTVLIGIGLNLLDDVVLDGDTHPPVLVAVVALRVAAADHGAVLGAPPVRGLLTCDPRDATSNIQQRHMASVSELHLDQDLVESPASWADEPGVEFVEGTHLSANGELRRSRRRLSARAAGEHRVPRRGREQKGRRLSTPTRN